MKHFLIFGTHPFLSLAEAKAVIGGRKPDTAGAMTVFNDVDWNGAVLQERLAGTVKLGDVVMEASMGEITAERLADEIEARPRAKKIEFGLTVYGGSATTHAKAKKLPLALKRVLQERGHSVRWVTGEAGEVTPAAVAKADLIGHGYDFAIGFFEDRAVVGLTTHVQDATAWSRRDYGRPFRDARTGMLPPKLARLMVNLGLGSFSVDRLSSVTLLDPFCGSGTILMEAGLLAPALTIIGSDIDKRQVDGCEKNLDWLVQEKILDQTTRKPIRTFVQAAETIDSSLESQIIDVIVTEGHLGKPLNGSETLMELKTQKRDIEQLWRNALSAFAKLQKRGGKIVCVWPVFVSSYETVVVDLKTELATLGYRQIDPLQGWLEKPVTLTYARPDQRVKRNIIVLEKL